MNAQPISWFRTGGERPVGGNTVWTKPVDDEPEFFISSACCSGEFDVPGAAAHIEGAPA